MGQFWVNVINSAWGEIPLQDAAKTHEKESCFEQDELCEQLGKIIVQPTVAEQTPQNSAPSAPLQRS